MINRRGFLKYLGAATVAGAAGIDLIDTAKTFFLPPAGGWRADYRKSEIWVIGEITTEIWTDYPKIGRTINVRRPPRYYQDRNDLFLTERSEERIILE